MSWVGIVAYTFQPSSDAVQNQEPLRGEPDGQRQLLRADVAVDLGWGAGGSGEGDLADPPHLDVAAADVGRAQQVAEEAERRRPAAAGEADELEPAVVGAGGGG